MNTIKQIVTLKQIAKAGISTAATLFLLLAISPNSLQANPLHASIAVDAKTGEVLHELHADAIRYPASLTKMMTLYMLFEALQQRKLSLDSRMPVSMHAASMPSTNINLRAGETIGVRDAIAALIVRSANDVAAVVAETLGKTEANFARMMTDKARAMGMRATTFRNASGLPHSEQKTTARDLLTLSTRLMKDFPQYYHFFSTQSFTHKGITYNSHNRMLRNARGVDGLKTGFIRASGFNVATSAKRGDRRIIAVVMGGHTAVARDQYMSQLLDRSFSQGMAIPTMANNTSNGHIKPVARPTNIARTAPQSTEVKREAPGSSGTAPVIQAKVPIHPPKNAVLTSKNWEVQVGSYQAHERAHAQAQAATRWIPGEVVVTEVKISNQKLYRARLVGLQENQARMGCQNLSRQRMECLVIRSQG
ncbi:MAG: D-alanyl-D-alanine carboxypeptidase [Nitrosomonas sp. PRO4]|nr:D-alanyl-D-alanine carboxypeptidase [Nitrosomonas sp. PRO4]